MVAREGQDGRKREGAPLFLTCSLRRQAERGLCTSGAAPAVSITPNARAARPPLTRVLPLAQITVRMEDGEQVQDEAASGNFMPMDESNLQSGAPRPVSFRAGPLQQLLR